MSDLKRLGIFTQAPIMKNTFNIIILSLTLVFNTIAYAAIEGKSIDTLQAGSPEGITINYLKEMKSGNYESARKMASDYCFRTLQHKLKTQDGVRQNIDQLIFTEYALRKKGTLIEEDRCVVALWVRTRKDNGSLGWGDYNGYFLKIDGKWLQVHFAEYTEKSIFPKNRYMSLFN
jgi:hypothetical protein